jgi:dCMP deaminase
MWRSADNLVVNRCYHNELTKLCIQGICAGKHAIAEYLIEHQGFQLLELTTKCQSQPESGDDLRLQASEIRLKEGPKSPEFTFQDADSLLDFATKRWQERWVTTDIADASTLDRFLLRPFFLLVGIDAPVSLRWKRFADRFVMYNVWL